MMFDRFRGVLPKSVGEGTHFLVPFIQNPTIYDIRTRPKSITSVTGTKDLQQVNLTLRVLHRPDVDRLPEIHMNLGPEYEERVLPSIGNEVLKATVAQFNADQLLTHARRGEQEGELRAPETREGFRHRAGGCRADALSFGVEYSRAIEAKQVSQQDAERSKFVVLRSEQEREAAVIRAEGESESARLISQATKSAGPRSSSSDASRPRGRWRRRSPSPGTSCTSRAGTRTCSSVVNP